MTLGPLSREQGFALLAEVNSTRNLLGYGIRVIRDGGFFINTRDPILTTLSIGVEKLYKLTVGLSVLEDTGLWPPQKVMKGHGHHLLRLHDAVMQDLHQRTSDKSSYVRGLLADVEADPVIPPVIDALDLYGKMGRFYFLDQLGASPQAVHPDAAWQAIERAVLVDPAVSGLLATATADAGDSDVWDSFNQAVRERLASSVERLWTMVAVCGRNHAWGDVGATFGFEVHPDMVVVP